ncbi:MAG: hypothetical protein ABSA26_02370 [Thermoguttaceae bacterium]|jgi:hypothetical protein
MATANGQLGVFRAAARGRTTAINVVEPSIQDGKFILGDPDHPTTNRPNYP